MDTERKCPRCGKRLPTNAPHGMCPECLLHAGFPSGVDPNDPTQPARGGFVPPPASELAPLFPQLEILELLGQGGMGAVYKARQPALDRFVALKLLPPRPSSDTGFAERFNREARALAKLCHPNIVAVHDFGVSGKFHFFIMEYVEGGNLRDLQQAGRFSPKEALKIIPQICEALQYAHDEGVVHRDIKPENVMLDKRGRVKITDFGLAKIAGTQGGEQRLTGAKDVMGTPHYMAPEQVEHPLEVDHRADIYSLGVVFYEMLTGELPLGRFAPPSRKVQVDVRLDEVVLHTLEKEPTRRYQHASEVKEDVEHIANGQTSQAKANVIPETILKRAVLVARWFARILSVLFLLLYAVFIAAEGSPPIFAQPTGVRLNFLALTIMLVGLVLGWKREGLAAVLILLGSVFWNSLEGLRLTLFQVPMLAAAAYAFCWWATRGRPTRVVVQFAVGFALMLLAGRILIPANVFVRGRIADAVSGAPVPRAELFLANSQPAEKRDVPNARSRTEGRFDLYVPWYAAGTGLRIEAPGFKPLTTGLERRPLGAKNVYRDFKLEPEAPLASPTIPPVVIATFPESGSAEVNPAINELSVTFSMPMTAAWSWVKIADTHWPELTGEPRFLENARTCVVPVRLQPGKTYALWLNVDKYQLFQGTNGLPSVPYLLVFKTRDQL